MIPRTVCKDREFIGIAEMPLMYCCLASGQEAAREGIKA